MLTTVIRPLYTPRSMSPKELTAFRFDAALLDGLRAVKERDGIPIAEQVRRAVEAWLDSRGVTVKKTERKRVAARKRS
jgi:hypothetical protein